MKFKVVTKKRRKRLFLQMISIQKKYFRMEAKQWKMKNRITELFNIEYPLIQAGMIWCSGWELASAVSNSGGLGIIGSGSMYPEILEEHVVKCMKATDGPFAVNLPMLYPDIDKHIETIIKHKVPIVFTSAGNPKTWTAQRFGSKMRLMTHIGHE